MKKRIFTLLMAFLAIAGNAVWGQETGSGTENDPWKIDITGITSSKWTANNNDGSSYSVNKGEDNNNVVTIKTDGFFLIKDDGDDDTDKSNVQIKFATGVSNVGITLEGVKINAYLDNTRKASSGTVYPDRCAMEIPSSITVRLNWEGDNKLWSGGNRAGINVQPGATLILAGPTGSGSLEAGSFNNSDNTHTFGAGIGGDKNEPDFGNIIIESGTIRAYAQVQAVAHSSDAYGAGIGGGYNETSGSTSGSILITGGTITAQCENRSAGGAHGAGIGGGHNGTCDNITILGGTVTAISDATNDIGANGTVSKYPEIIIGNAEKGANPETSVTGSVDNTNYVNGLDSPSKKGTVTMPDGLQMYVEESFSGDGTFNAYNVKLTRTLLGEHDITGWDNAADVQNYYLGAGKELTIDALECNNTPSDLFLGWYNSNDNVVAVSTKDGKETTTFKAPDKVTAQPVTYSAVWVESERSITIKTGENGKDWTKDGDGPSISYVPTRSGESEPDAGDALTFAIQKYDDSVTVPVELTDWSFDGNQLQGKSNLQVGDTYKTIKVTAQVTMGGCTKYITLNVTLRKDVTISNVTIKNPNHVYTGEHHNDLGTNGQEHLLSVTVDDESEQLQEEYFYRIYSYKFNNSEQATTAQENSKESVKLVDAGTYSDITIQPLEASFAETLDTNGDEFYTITGNSNIVTIAQRPLNITFSVEGNVVEGEEPVVNAESEKYNATDNRGLVKEEQPVVKWEIDYKYNDDQTQMTVYIKNITVNDNIETGFKTSNYDIKYVINGKTYKMSEEQEGEEEVLPEEGVEIGTIDVVSSSTGTGIDHRYQLYLANKDYLDYGVTEEYYDKLGLELFSRHNKKYTDAGGSFTIWYEKDGVANDGNYRIFWSNRANGDYREVKFDEVSGYYQIRNVNSNVYVKIFDEAGFPVANESIAATDVRAYAQAGKIVVVAPEPTDVQIISMAGAVVATDKVTGQREFTNLAEGVYIVRIGETVVKLQVRN